MRSVNKGKRNVKLWSNRTVNSDPWGRKQCGYCTIHWRTTQLVVLFWSRPNAFITVQLILHVWNVFRLKLQKKEIINKEMRTSSLSPKLRRFYKKGVLSSVIHLCCTKLTVRLRLWSVTSSHEIDNRLQSLTHLNFSNNIGLSRTLTLHFASLLLAWCLYFLTGAKKRCLIKNSAHLRIFLDLLA